MKAKRWIAVAGLAAGAVGLATGCGGPLGGGSPERAERFVSRRVDDALDDLKATDPQRQTVNALKDSAVQDVKAFMAEQRKAREEVLALWNVAAPDAAQAHALVNRRIDALRALAHAMTDSALQLHGALTPEQRAELAGRWVRGSHHWRGRGHGSDRESPAAQ